MRRRSPLAIGIGLALLVVPLIAAPASARSEHDRIVAYWTPARMAAATPRDLTPKGAHVAPRAGKPGGGGAAVLGASWPNNTQPVADLSGKVFFHMAGGDWQCSGSVATDARTGYSTVVTAGHCAIDETTGEFATNWLFMPNWDRKPATFATACSGSFYGCWTALGIYVHYGFAHAGSFNNQAVTHDWAFVVVGSGGKGGSVPAQLDARGAYNVGFLGTVATGNRLALFGYSAAGKYHGNDLIWSAGNVVVDVASSNGSPNNATWGVASDQTGGSSGGPWIKGLNENNGSGGTVNSVNSYGYSGVKAMFGPKFNANTQATYSAATSGTPANTVVGSAP